jgi:hypothetical protein
VTGRAFCTISFPGAVTLLRNGRNGRMDGIKFEREGKMYGVLKKVRKV